MKRIHTKQIQNVFTAYLLYFVNILQKINICNGNTNGNNRYLHYLKKKKWPPPEVEVDFTTGEKVESLVQKWLI